MGNTVPRAGLKATSLAFWGSVLPLHHVGFPDVITIPMPTCLYSSVPQTSVQTTVQAVISHTQGRFNNHPGCSLCRTMLMATSVMSLMIMGNSVPKTGIEPTYLAFPASVLTITPGRLPDGTTIPTPTSPCSSLPMRSVQNTTVVMMSIEQSTDNYIIG